MQDWHLDGVVLMIDRGCKTLSAGQEEQIIEPRNAGNRQWSMKAAMRIKGISMRQ
ncbi:MAG: hypothetical protein ACMUIM_08920 [bacterium]